MVPGFFRAPPPGFGSPIELPYDKAFFIISSPRIKNNIFSSVNLLILPPLLLL